MIEIKSFIKCCMEYGALIMTSVSMIAALTLQYLMGERKGALAFYVVVASTLVAGMMIHHTLNYLGVAGDNPLRSLALIMSSLVGTAMVSMIIRHAPNAIRDKLMQRLKEL